MNGTKLVVNKYISFDAINIYIYILYQFCKFIASFLVINAMLAHWSIAQIWEEWGGTKTLTEVNDLKER